MTTSPPIKLRIPDQDLAQFSLFALNTEAAEQWAQGLAVTNTKLVVQQLRQAIGDLNRVVIPPDLRFSIMEVLRPSLSISLSALSKRFLNQPLVLPEEPRQMSELANTLYGLATTAYTIVAIHTIKQRDSILKINPARLVCEALQRAIGFSTGKLLQTYQLYQPIEPHAWLELHQMYALAERQQLTNLPVVDKLSGGGSIRETYLRALILGCCKPNQLRQNDLAGIALGLQEWSEHLRLEGPETGRGLFQVDLSDDHPPMYSALTKDSTGSNNRFIDTEGLVKHLQALKLEDDRLGKPGITLDKDTHLPANILDHLIGSLGTMSKRNFARGKAGHELRVTLGLTNVHYFISGGLTFEQLIHGADSNDDGLSAANPFMVPVRNQDKWANANPQEDLTKDDIDFQIDDSSYRMEEVMVDDATQANFDHQPPAVPAAERYRDYTVQIIDASPGGYCMEWSSELPSGIKAGDIVGIRDEDNVNWVVAVARWVSQLQNARTLIGVELLSPKAMPYGARVMQTTGVETELVRVLLLPEIKLVGQPHTLITPKVGFRERQKVSLIRDGEQFHVQLLRQIVSTGSFAQFDFRYIKLLEDVIAEDKSGPLGAAYDSLWTNI